VTSARSRQAATLAARSRTTLLYLARPSDGKRTGRNIGGPHNNEATDLEAVHSPIEVEMHDFRESDAPPSLVNDGFELLSLEPVGESADFDSAHVVEALYARVQALVRNAVGADSVFVFDHTLRVSGAEGLNSLDGRSVAGAVLRVHGDYTAASGPVRLNRLLDDGVVRLPGGGDAWSGERFAFVNVWQSIDAHHPVLQHPLALCRPRSVDYPRTTWPYFMHFEHRIGQNLALSSKESERHEWGYYPRMRHDEAICFITYDSSKATREVGVVHTAFEDPSIDGHGVRRQSVELRTVAMWRR
jgi:hypothetical protein